MDPPKYNDVPKLTKDSHKFSLLDNEKANTEELPIYVPHSANNREFVMFSDTVSGNILAFVSDDSKAKYNSFKTKLDDRIYLKIVELQKEGIGIPILKTKISNNVFNSKCLSIYKFKRPEIGKIFNHKVDRYVFCDVTHSSHARCHKYTLRFNPSPGNPNQVFEFNMYRHHSLPIVDFTYQDRKFRWVHESYPGGEGFRYILYGLNKDEVSMVDDLDLKKQIPSKNNPLMKNLLKNYFKRNSKTREQFSNDFPIAELKYVLGNFMSYESSAMFITPEKFTTNNRNSESILSVDDSTLVNLCLALVLKRFKDEEKMERDILIVI